MVTTILWLISLMTINTTPEVGASYITVSIHTPRMESPALYIEKHGDILSLEESLNIGQGERLSGSLTDFQKDTYYLLKIQSHQSLADGEVSKLLSVGILRYTAKGWKILELETGPEPEYDFSYVLLKG